MAGVVIEGAVALRQKMRPKSFFASAQNPAFRLEISCVAQDISLKLGVFGRTAGIMRYHSTCAEQI